MFYYKIFNTNEEYIGMITSYDFRQFVSSSKIMLCCSEKNAHYFCFKNQFYRVEALKKEPQETKGLYPIVILRKATKEEYEEYIKEQEEKEILEQK